MAWRCLFWVQSLLGAGHLRRALLLAEAFAARGAAVTLVNGGRPGGWTTPAGVDLVQLPPVAAGEEGFGRLVDAGGADVTAALWADRRDRLFSLLTQTAPHVVLTEMFPFGRRAFRVELLPWLQAARERCRPPLVVASVRDVLVSKSDPGRHVWMAETCRAFYDRVLVHGDERLLPFALSFPFAAALETRIVHTGFVRPLTGSNLSGPVPAVLVTAGGGAVGAGLLRAALAARPLTRLAKAPWLLVGGRNLPGPAFAALQATLPPGCRLERHRDDIPALMARCRLSVSQAGYNTVVEALSGDASMVLVPYAAGGEDEQTKRARRLAALGIAELVAETGLTPEALAAAIDRAVARPRRRSGPAWSFDGAAFSADMLARLVEERFGRAPG